MKRKINFIWLVLAIIIFSIPPFIWPDCEFLKYTFMDIITGIGVSYGIYYYSYVNDERNNKASKTDQVIDIFRERLMSLFSKPIDVENNKEEYYHTFKYLDNKFKLLENMTKSFSCEKEIEKIRDNLEKIETFITDNINETNDYFAKNSERKEKIPNLMDTIEVQLDNITIKLFSFDGKN